MLTIEDIRDTATNSGFRHVHEDHGGSHRPRPFRAQDGAGNTHGAKDATRPARWKGSRRATAEESAQDYCDYINGSTVAQPPQPQLKSAGHKRVTKKHSPAVQAAAKAYREALAAEKEAQGSSWLGYIYLVAETFGREGNGSALYDGTLVSSKAVKVGYSDSPPDEGRMGGLQTGNPRLLVLLGTIRGTRDDESALHAKYISDNVLQEWFRPTRELFSEFDVGIVHMGYGCLWATKQKGVA